jgi:hypothetical protein
MNRDTISAAPMFSAARHSHSLGLLLAGALFAVVALGGSSAIARNFVTAGAFASVAARTVPQVA